MAGHRLDDDAVRELDLVSRLAREQRGERRAVEKPGLPVDEPGLLLVRGDDDDRDLLAARDAARWRRR